MYLRGDRSTETPFPKFPCTLTWMRVLCSNRSGIRRTHSEGSIRSQRQRDTVRLSITYAPRIFQSVNALNTFDFHAWAHTLNAGGQRQHGLSVGNSNLCHGRVSSALADGDWVDITFSYSTLATVPRLGFGAVNIGVAMLSFAMHMSGILRSRP